MRRSAVKCVLLFGALAASSAAVGADAPAPLAVPSAADLVAPPRVALGPDGRLFVADPVAGGVDVVASKETASPYARFGEPVPAVRRDDLLVGGRRGPRIAASRDAVVLAAVTKRTKDGGGDLYAWRSADGGATWGEAVRVNDAAGRAPEGLFDLAALADGRFAVVWLETNDKEKGQRLRADFSADGAKWGEDVLAYASPDGSICECCHPAITAAEGGGAVVAFRNSMKGDRDIWTMRLARGAVKFDAAKKSGKDSWRIAGCPMAGPAVVAHGDDVVSVWRRERDVFLVVGAAKERDLGEGNEPAAFVGADGVHAVWISKDGALVHLAPAAKEPVTVAQGAAFPCAAGAGVVAWFDTATRRARVAEVR